MNGYVYVRSICSQRPLRRLLPYGKHLGHGVLHRVHRDLTSAGFSASSVEKYHYHSDCHCRFSSKLNFRSGILARSPYINRKSPGVPTFGLFIRTNVLSACLFNFQGTLKGGNPLRENNPFTHLDKGGQNAHPKSPLFRKKFEKNFFDLENCS